MKCIIVTLLLASGLYAPAEAARWNVDYRKSNLGFQVQWAGEPFVATFKSWKADIDFDPGDLVHSHVAVTIDPASETSDTAENDEGIHGAEGFAVSKFPTARFAATRFAHESGNEYSAAGTLTIRGVTRPVTLMFILKISGEEALVTVKASLTRTDFGLGTSQEWAGETPIAHRVTVTANIEATKAH